MKATHNFKSPELLDGKMTMLAKSREVKVMAIVDKYGMVRVSGYSPFVVPTKELYIEGYFNVQA